MYLRAAHADLNIPRLREFIRQNPFGLLISSIQSENFPEIQCTHIPWLLDLKDENDETELGTLRGHMAKPNPHTKSITEAISKITENGYGALESEVSIMFTGPAHSYVTPQFYTTTKPATGKVVPTWNYTAVQVYGRLTAYYSSQSEVTQAFLQKAVEDLSNHAEHNIKHESVREKAWTVSDAPDSYVNLLKKNIIGLEVVIERLEGKWKMSQEIEDDDRAGVIKGFGELGTDEGREIAHAVEERGRLKDEEAAERKKTQTS
jgi:transcriptional regulator